MTFRAAIIGCGIIAGRVESWSAPTVYSHAKAYATHGAFGELAFVDRHPDRARSLARKAGGTAFETADELMAAFRPDVVSVCVPDDVHSAILEWLLDSPRAPRLVFAEKPVCVSRDEFARLLARNDAGRPAIVVNHSRRFDAAHQRLKALLAGSGLGPAVHVQVDYYGGWRHLGVHVVDTLQYFFDAALELTDVRYACPSRYRDDPTLNVSGRIASARVRLDGHPEERYQILDMNILCEAGQVRVTDFGRRIEVLRRTINREGENVLELDAAASGAGMDGPMRHAVDVIARYLERGDRRLVAPYGLEQAGRTMETVWTGMEMYAAQS